MIVREPLHPVFRIVLLQAQDLYQRQPELIDFDELMKIGCTAALDTQVRLAPQRASSLETILIHDVRKATVAYIRSRGLLGPATPTTVLWH